jgi:hypothetical protein
MEPAVQPEDDKYVITTDTLRMIDRDLIDNRALLAIFDRVKRDEPVMATAFTNFVS